MKKMKKKKAKSKGKARRTEGYYDDEDDPEPFFDNVDEHISQILEMKEKEDKSGKSRRESLSLEVQAQRGMQKFSASARPGPYTYQGSDVGGPHTLATGIANPKLWGETAMAAAWMPSSFYQEYVRTQKGGTGGNSREQRGKGRRSTLQMMENV